MLGFLPHLLCGIQKSGKVCLEWVWPVKLPVCHFFGVVKNDHASVKKPPRTMPCNKGKTGPYKTKSISENHPCRIYNAYLIHFPPLDALSWYDYENIQLTVNFLLGILHF